MAASTAVLPTTFWWRFRDIQGVRWGAGGDAFLTDCLWEQGFGHTTPDPLWHPAGLQMFDPSPPPLNPDDFILPKAAHVMGNLLQQAAGVCRGLCQVLLVPDLLVLIRQRVPKKCTPQASTMDIEDCSVNHVISCSRRSHKQVHLRDPLI